VKITGQYTRATSFAILTIALVTAAALLTGLLLLLLDAAGKAEPEKQRHLVKLASLTMGALVLSVVILVGLIARYVAYRLTHPPEPAARLSGPGGARLRRWGGLHLDDGQQEVAGPPLEAQCVERPRPLVFLAPVVKQPDVLGPQARLLGSGHDLPDGP